MTDDAVRTIDEQDVELLRGMQGVPAKAADEIERLRAENGRLRDTVAEVRERAQWLLAETNRWSS